MKRVLLTDLARLEQPMLGALLDAVARVAGSARYIGGEPVAAFERELAAALGARHVVAVASGTDALTLALRALGVGPGEEVIVPSVSFTATAEAVVLAGGRPRFADVDPRTGLLTPDSLEAAWSARTVGAVAVHLHGRAAPRDALAARARAAGGWLLEDAAQAAGAEDARGPLGGSGLACLSFYPTKNLGGWGDGGALLTEDASLAETVRQLANHGRTGPFDHELAGTNSRLDAVQAAVLRVKLLRLGEHNARRRAIARRYLDAIDGRPQLATPPISADESPAWHVFAVLCEARDALAAHLDACGIDSAAVYPAPLTAQPAWREVAGAAVFPGADAFCRQVLAVPVHPALDDAEVARVADALAGFAER